MKPRIRKTPVRFRPRHAAVLAELFGCGWYPAAKASAAVRRLIALAEAGRPRALRLALLKVRDLADAEER